MAISDIDWSKGYKSKSYMTILDRETFLDIDQVQLTGGSINRTTDELRQSADLDCKDYQNSKEEIVRVWLDVYQDSNYSRTPLFTGLATSPVSKYEGRIKNNTLQCYSLLKIAQDVMLPRGWYAPYDTDSGDLIKELLSVIGTEIHMPEDTPTPRLTTAIVSEQGENHLSMTDKILDAINWRLIIAGDGDIFVKPYDTTPVLSLNSITNDAIETSIDVEYDWYSAPNVYRAIADDLCSIARDDDPDSEFSTVSRGREIWVEETNVSLNANETLADYARRRLKEEQATVKNISYTRRFFPEIFPGDILEITYPAQGITGNYLITDQTITIGHNAKTSEEVVQV